MVGLFEETGDGLWTIFGIQLKPEELKGAKWICDKCDLVGFGTPTRCIDGMVFKARNINRVSFADAFSVERYD